MANYIATDGELTAVADAIRTKGGTSAALSWPTGFTDAIDAISSGGNDFIVTVSWNDSTQLWEPDCTVYEWQDAYTGGKNIILNGDGCSIAGWFYDDDYSFVYGIYTGSSSVNGMDLHEYWLTTQGLDATGTETYILPTFASLTRTYTPTTSQQTETIAIPQFYNGIEQVSVTVNAMPTGAAGTPTATKSSVSNHSVSVTPKVTNTTGYITGGTKTGTAVTVSASELVSGSETKTANGTYDVTNLAEVVVNVSGGASMNAQTAQSTTRVTSTSYTEVISLICDTAGTYDVYWSTHRTSTSGTWGSQLYLGNTAYGTAQTGSWSNHIQNIHLTGVSISANQEVSVRVRSRGNGYYGYVGTLTIIQTA